MWRESIVLKDVKYRDVGCPWTFLGRSFLWLASRALMNDDWVRSFLIDIVNEKLGRGERRIVLLKHNGVALRGPGRIEIQKVGIAGEACKSVSVRFNHPNL